MDNKFEELRKLFEIPYTPETLPPHPAWCARASEPRSVCAQVSDEGVITCAVHHAEAGANGAWGEPMVLVEQVDFAAFGPGDPAVTVGDEMTPLTLAEARDLAGDLLAVCDFVERYRSAA